MRKYTASQDERLDRICRAHYGTERGGTVELVLDANPGLAALGPVLPLGTVVALPSLTVSAVPIRKTIRLWGET